MISTTVCYCKKLTLFEITFIGVADNIRMDKEIIETSFFSINGSDVMKYNNTKFLLPGSTILTVTICTGGILANSLIIIVVLFGSLRNFVIMNLRLALAITDSLYLLVIIQKQRGIFGTILSGPSLLQCRLSVFFLFAMDLASSWITVFIAVERFIAICFPFKVHVLCNRNESSLTLLVITTLALCASTPFLQAGSVFLIKGNFVCRLKSENLHTDFIVVICIYLFYSIIPFSIITALNILIIRRVRSQRAFRIRYQLNTSTLGSGSRDTTLVLMMTAICTVFIVTSFPSSLFMIYNYSHRYVYGETFQSEDWLSRFFFLLEDINHCVNFFLYCISGSIFRAALFEMLKCRKRQSHTHQSHEIMTISQNVEQLSSEK